MAPDAPAELDRARRESVWERAKRDAGNVYRSTAFAITLALVGLMAASIAVLFTVGPEVALTTQIVVPLLSGVTSIAIAVLVVVAWQSGAAPVRQRNELRRDWPVGPTEKAEKAPDVELTIRDYIRRGALLANFRGVTREHETQVEAWAAEVISFLSAHATSGTAKRFITASDGESGGPKSMLRVQLVTLREIAAEYGDSA